MDEKWEGRRVAVRGRPPACIAMRSIVGPKGRPSHYTDNFVHRRRLPGRGSGRRTDGQAASGGKFLYVNLWFDSGSNIFPLDNETRIEEIARGLGGKNLTSVTIKHAHEMLEKSNTSERKK